MKKLSTLLLCTAIFASCAALPSPTKNADQTLVADLGSTEMVVAIQLTAAPSMEYYGMENAFVFSAGVYQEAVIQKSDISNDEKIYSPNSEIFLHRHYFNPEDNREFPPYTPGDLSEGFTTEIYRPAR